jgi:hypothetical protein
MIIVSKQGHNGRFGKFAPGPHDVSLKENALILAAYKAHPETFTDAPQDEDVLLAEAAAAAADIISPEPLPIAKAKLAPKAKAPRKPRKPSGKAVNPG